MNTHLLLFSFLYFYSFLVLNKYQDAKKIKKVMINEINQPSWTDNVL